MVQDVGAVVFGVVIGWVTYRTLRRQSESVALSNIATVVGAVGGAAVTGLFSGDLFAWYSIGLGVGFFVYLTLAVTLLKNEKVAGWLGSSDEIGPAL